MLNESQPLNSCLWSHKIHYHSLRHPTLTLIAYYLHSTDRDVSMQSFLVGQNEGRRSWDVRFFYDFNNWEFIFYYTYQKKKKFWESDLVALFLHLLESNIFLEWVVIKWDGGFKCRSLPMEGTWGWRPHGHDNGMRNDTHLWVTYQEGLHDNWLVLHVTV